MVGYAAFDFSQLVAFFWFRRVEYLLRSFQEFKGRVSSLGSKCSVYLLIFGLVLISICRSGFSGSVDLFFWARFFLFFPVFAGTFCSVLLRLQYLLLFSLFSLCRCIFWDFFYPSFSGLLLLQVYLISLCSGFFVLNGLFLWGCCFFFLFFLPRFTLLGFLAISC
jgi:hypothetical protein